MNYYKANKKVAEYLNLTNERNETKDKNYILWVADINRFGSLGDIDKILSDIGAVALSPVDARKELTGEVCTPMPVPADERFVIGTAVVEKDTAVEDNTTSETLPDNTEGVTTTDGNETENPNAVEETYTAEGDVEPVEEEGNV